VLLTLIGGYIYLGMERAKEQPQADVTIEESADQAVELTTEERLQILDSLSTDSGEGEVSLTPEDRQAVLESLETSSGVESEGEASVEMSPEDRRALLDSLQ
jgi:hypothetical protein